MKLSGIIRASVRSRESVKEGLSARTQLVGIRGEYRAGAFAHLRPILSSRQMNRPLTGLSARPRHARCPSSLRTKLERGWSWNPISGGLSRIRRRGDPHGISHQSPDVRPPTPSDLIRNGRKTMRAPAPSDGLGIKWLFSQGLDRYTDLKEYADPAFFKLPWPTLKRNAQICVEITFFLGIFF